MTATILDGEMRSRKVTQQPHRSLSKSSSQGIKDLDLNSHPPMCWNQALNVLLRFHWVLPGDHQTFLQGNCGELSDLLGQRNFIICRLNF